MSSYHDGKRAPEREENPADQQAAIQHFAANSGDFTQYLVSRILFITLVSSLIGLLTVFASAIAQGMGAFAETAGSNGGRIFFSVQQLLFAAGAFIDVISTIVVIWLARRTIGTYREVTLYKALHQDSDAQIRGLRTGSDSVGAREKTALAFMNPASRNSRKFAPPEGFEDLRLYDPSRFLSAPIPITMYLSDATAHEEVEVAVESILVSTGLEIYSRDEPLPGSWFRSMKAKLSRVPSELARDTVSTAIDVVEPRTVTAHEAQITAIMMQNLPGVLSSLNSTKDAVIRVGSLLIVKVDETVTVTQLTAAQQFYLDHNPALATMPQHVLQALGINSAQGTYERMTGNGSKPHRSLTNDDSQTEGV